MLNFSSKIRLDHGRRQRGAGGRGPWIFIHGIDIVDRGLIVLFFGKSLIVFFFGFFSVAPPPLWKFFCRRPWGWYANKRWYAYKKNV